LHTEHDGIVDVKHGKQLYQWARGSKKIKIFQHGNHNDILFKNAREYFHIIKDFIATLG